MRIFIVACLLMAGAIGCTIPKEMALLSNQLEQNLLKHQQEDRAIKQMLAKVYVENAQNKTNVFIMSKAAEFEAAIEGGTSTRDMLQEWTADHTTMMNQVTADAQKDVAVLMRSPTLDQAIQISRDLTGHLENAARIKITPIVQGLDGIAPEIKAILDNN
jgi:hypothetical protein